MRGIGLTLSRLPATRALLAGVAMLATMSAPKAIAQTQDGLDDTALAVPRVSPRGASGVALPHPLAPSDAVRIRQIFALQARDRIPAALREVASLDASDPTLHGILGHLAADRHLGRTTRPDAAELADWLVTWGALPDARAIHALLIARLPRGAPRPAPPATASWATPDDGQTSPIPEEVAPADQLLNRNPALDRAVRLAARNGAQGAAGRLIGRSQGLSAAYRAQLKGEAAQIMFTLNRDQEAYALASSAFAGTGCDGAALAGLQAGLAAWRMDRPELARPMFEAAWLCPYTTPSLRAAAAYWAARGQQRLGNLGLSRLWLYRAAEDGRTFYGLLARRALGLSVGLPADGRETLAEADVEAVAATPAGLRAFALLQVGQTGRAEAELRLLGPAARAAPALGRALMLVAQKAGLVDLAAQFADLVQAADGRPRDVLRFPIPQLAPVGGFVVDRALVYALARTESNFDTTSVSSAGARGLMQIMPETARFLTGEGPAAALHDPAVNLDIGQRYIAHLAGLDVVGGDLIRLLASYNSGPGHFARWAAAVQDRADPLLFIEAVPIDETRSFIPRVLTYYWIYAARMRLPAPSLADLAEGVWPRYAAPAATPALPTRSAALH